MHLTMSSNKKRKVDSEDDNDDMQEIPSNQVKASKSKSGDENQNQNVTNFELVDIRAEIEKGISHLPLKKRLLKLVEQHENSAPANEEVQMTFQQAILELMTYHSKEVAKLNNTLSKKTAAAADNQYEIRPSRKEFTNLQFYVPFKRKMDLHVSADDKYLQAIFKGKPEGEIEVEKIAFWVIANDPEKKAEPGKIVSFFVLVPEKNGESEMVLSPELVFGGSNKLIDSMLTQLIKSRELEKKKCTLLYAENEVLLKSVDGLFCFLERGDFKAVYFLASRKPLIVLEKDKMEEIIPAGRTTRTFDMQINMKSGKIYPFTFPIANQTRITTLFQRLFQDPEDENRITERKNGSSSNPPTSKSKDSTCSASGGFQTSQPLGSKNAPINISNLDDSDADDEDYDPAEDKETKKDSDDDDDGDDDSDSDSDSDSGDEDAQSDDGMSAHESDDD